MRIVGLMSGTSLDGVDGALLETNGNRILGFGPTCDRPYTAHERTILEDAVEAALIWRFQGERPSIFAEAEVVLEAVHGEVVEEVCQAAGLLPSELDGVGFHGQTVVHEAPTPEGPGRTCQIGSGQRLAERLGCRVAYDFRSHDMREGGQGAPLAPIYHRALVEAAGLEMPIAVLNLGGVGNITLIEADGSLTAFDTGPANGLIDAFVQARQGLAHDMDGALAAQGRFHEAAMAELLDHPHFTTPGPKSLDRWDFSLEPVANLSDEDGAATLTGFTARAVALGLDHIATRPSRIIACGGGRKNKTMMALIEAACGIPVMSAESVGWRGDMIEAEAFAYLAARTFMALPISFPGTTGVMEPLTGGEVAFP